jgi:hypothetical protein
MERDRAAQFNEVKIGDQILVAVDEFVTVTDRTDDRLMVGDSYFTVESFHKTVFVKNT